MTQAPLLPNFAMGRWHSGTGAGTPLFDPVLGHTLVRVDATGLDLAGAFAYARDEGGRALRALSYRERGALLGRVLQVLQSQRAQYEEIATANSGTVAQDSAIDIDGALFTLGSYARMGEALGEGQHLPDGEMVRLGRDALFQSRHVLAPTRGVALLINAFNFPAWGLWEKAAPALLSGVPVVLKPATATAWLAQRMVQDVVNAGILPPGALSVICGSSHGLLEQLQPLDVLSFTGSADTAALIRSHAAVAQRSVRVNVEADSLNAALLLPGASQDSLELLAKEVAREMTAKSGQKCTAIRRVLVPQEHYDAVAQAVGARLARTTVGNPRSAGVRMGSLVSRAQWQAVRDGLAQLTACTQVLHDGASHPWVDADPEVACIAGPSLLGCADPDATALVHDVEVFGPVATLMPYRDLEHALALVRRGQGSLVASVFGEDSTALAQAALALADSHGRVHVVSPEVASAHTGHGNVMPQSLHGGPGRAGGGEELGGLRALNFYHRRCAIQASTAVLEHVNAPVRTPS